MELTCRKVEFRHANSDCSTFSKTFISIGRAIKTTNEMANNIEDAFGEKQSNEMREKLSKVKFGKIIFFIFKFSKTTKISNMWKNMFNQRVKRNILKFFLQNYRRQKVKKYKGQLIVYAIHQIKII